MSYVDGYLVPVPTANVDSYTEMAELAASIWMEHGALQYVEAVADDVQEGQQTDFFRAVDRKEGETVFFSFAVYRDRAHRDEVMAKVMADPRLKCDPATMPFDGKRMVWGGFRSLVER